MTAKVAIYDSSPVVIAGMKSLLAQPGLNIVGSTSDPEEFIRCILFMKPNFIIVDPASMEEYYLLQISQLERLLNQMKIVIYASSESAYHIIRIHKIPYMAYLSKQQPVEKLAEVIQDSRSAYVMSDSEYPLSEESMMLVRLTPRELQILREIGAGKANKTIAEEMQLSSKTISTYKRNIMHKFKTRDVRVVVDFARRHGF